MHKDAQALFDLVPATGEISYDELYVQANGRQLKHFHDMRRNGQLTVRREKIDGRLKLFVSRGESGVSDAN